MKNLKFHAIAITAITIIIIVLYMAMGINKPAPEVEATPQPGDRQIEINSATWGANCNDEMDRVMEDQTNAPLPTDASGKIIPRATFTKVEPNNVLALVRQHCNNKFRCELRADIKTMGSDPMPTCFKNLVVSYSCFAFDRAETITVSQSDHLKLDCRSTAPQHAPAEAPAQ